MTPLFAGSSIDDFVGHYTQLPDLSRYVALGYNKTRLLEVFEDFIGVVDAIVKSEVKLPCCLANQKTKITAYVEQYLFMRTYP